jgi:hypothetical protein
MTLQDLKDLLLTIGPPVFHYSAAGQKGNYIVWAEDSDGASEYADNKKVNHSIQGTIDYFTKTEFDPIVDEIQDKLTEAEISWRLNSVQHEKDTGYIHYEWVWELV